jgi:hypothetical protein
MGLNALNSRKMRKLEKLTGLTPIVRATTYSHTDYWRIRLTLRPHQHATYNRRSRVTIVEPKGRSNLCTTLCWELFPEDF